MTYQETLQDAMNTAAHQVNEGRWGVEEVKEFLQLVTERAGDKMHAATARAKGRELMRTKGQLILG